MYIYFSISILFVTSFSIRHWLYKRSLFISFPFIQFSFASFRVAPYVQETKMGIPQTHSSLMSSPSSSVFSDQASVIFCPYLWVSYRQAVRLRKPYLTTTRRKSVQVQYQLQKHFQSCCICPWRTSAITSITTILLEPEHKLRESLCCRLQCVCCLFDLSVSQVGYLKEGNVCRNSYFH